MLVAQKKDTEADKVAASWMAAHPKDVGFQFYLGEAALATRNFPLAETRFQSVIRMAPDNAPALNKLAWLMTELHKRGAVEYAQKATTLAPDAPAMLGHAGGGLRGRRQGRQPSRCAEEGCLVGAREHDAPPQPWRSSIASASGASGSTDGKNRR